MRTSLLNLWKQIKMSLLNSRQQRQIIAIIFIAAAILITFIWLLLSPPAKKTLPPSPPPKAEKTPAEDYLICVASQQMTTGYTEAGSAPPGSSGQGYFPGSVAVHPRVGTQWGGDPRHPIIPFGTTLHLLDPQAVKINDQWYDTLIVNDTGDTNMRLWSAYPYWLDLYFGSTNYWSNRSARDYGTRKADYYWVEKWR